MSVAVSVSAEELLRALDRRSATLPAEISTFLVLEGCESMIANGPRELSGLASVRISEHGTVALSGPACDDETSARGLHRLLTTLLLAAGPELAPALRSLSEHGPRGGVFELSALRDELEAALVPLNRNASRRVLSRFAREASHPLVAPEDVDAALNSLLGVGERPANDAPVRTRPNLSPQARGGAAAFDPPSARERSRFDGADPSLIDPFDGLDLGDEDEHYREGADARRDLIDPLRSSGTSVRASTRPSFAPSATTDRDSLRSLRALAGESHAPGAPSAYKLFIGFALITVAIASVVVALIFRAPEPTAPPPAVLLDKVVEPAGGDLVVHVAQPNAQVLRFVGRAPATVEGLPVGVAHEFVATAEGHRPSRVLVPSDADWEATPEGALYELALQLDPIDSSGRAPSPSEAKRAATDNSALELGPSRLSSQDVKPSTRRGSIRLVATPRGARVYQLIGFSPDVTVQDLPLDQPQELLIYREGYAPQVRSLAESDFEAKNGRRVAELRVDLIKQ